MAEALRDRQGRTVKGTRRRDPALQSHEQELVDLLNSSGRTRGFLVVVRRAHSLQPLQAASFHQTGSECLTARYRLQPGPVLGTLLDAFLADLLGLRFENSPPPKGDLLPVIGARGWQSLTSVLGGPHRWPRASDDRGELDADLVEALLADLSRPEALSTSQRLVLFAELVQPPDRADASWDALIEFAHRLPERVGLVVSNPPDAFRVPTDDHFRELDTLPPLAGAPEAYRYTLSALRGDQPAARDLLGFGPYADALARLVLLPDTSPLVIGIQGPWGKGKSSFMQFVDDALVLRAPVNAAASATLANDADTNPERVGATWEQMRRDARRDVVTVHFDAWTFEDATQTWAGLARCITRGLEQTLPWWSRLLTPIAYAWRHRRAQLLLDLVLPALTLALVLALLALAGWDDLEGWASAQLGEVWGPLLPAGALALAAVGLLAARLHRVVKPVSERMLEYARMPDYREQLGYQHRVGEDIAFVYDRLARRHAPRVVVFIDNLDRCADEKVMEILRAIHLVLGPSSFYVFLGVDTEMIHRAIRRHYGDDPPLPPDFTDVYLRKIIQLPFHLPPAETTDEFLASLFSPAARVSPEKTSETDGSWGAPTAGQAGLAFDRTLVREPAVQVLKEVEDTPDELQAFLDFREFVGDNPRELKRLVNVHRLVKILLQRPDVAMAADDQRKLVKWLVFCTRWPGLIDDALRLAAASADDEDVLAELAPLGGDDLARLAARKDENDRLRAADLSRGGLLAKAAYLSRHIVDEALAAVKSESNASEQPPAP